MSNDSGFSKTVVDTFVELQKAINSEEFKSKRSEILAELKSTTDEVNKNTENLEKLIEGVKRSPRKP